MEQLQQEIRHAARRLARSPAFTLATVLTLALAIGANASIFAVVQRVVLNPLPYPESDRLIELDHGALLLNVPAGFGMTPGLYFHYVERSRTLEGVALYRADELTLTGDGEPERIRVARATPTLAAVLRVGPIVGRWFTEQEGDAGRRAGGRVVARALGCAGYGGDARHHRPSGHVGRRTDQRSSASCRPRLRSPIRECRRLDGRARHARSEALALWGYNGVARLRGGVDG